MGAMGGCVPHHTCATRAARDLMAFERLMDAAELDTPEAKVCMYSQRADAAESTMSGRADSAEGLLRAGTDAAEGPWKQATTFFCLFLHASFLDSQSSPDSHTMTTPWHHSRPLDLSRSTSPSARAFISGRYNLPSLQAWPSRRHWTNASSSRAIPRTS